MNVFFIQLLTDSMAQELSWDAITQRVKNEHKFLDLGSLPRNPAAGRLSHLILSVVYNYSPSRRLKSVFSSHVGSYLAEFDWQVNLLHKRVTSGSNFCLKAGCTNWHISWLSLVPPDKSRDRTLNQDTAASNEICSNSLITPPYSGLIWASESLLRNK
jgi:hypothetical protein